MLSIPLPVQAEEIKKDAEPTQEVNIKVIANAKAYQRPNKVQKSADSINKEQVSNIRDLTRYDPGISVVEQGKGATKGYAIYGVDRNRVAINLDGLEQAESFELDRESTSGARLEPEYEHITRVDISKGADSATNGSGALGGAVSLRTKSAKDIVRLGEKFGLRYKTGYFSKDHQWLNSLSMAADDDHFDALLIYTHRKGKEYQANIRNAPGRTFLVRSLVSKSNLEDPYLVNGWESQDRNIYLSPQDIVGENRLLPDPMKTQSESTLFKTGFKLGTEEEHYLSIVGESEKKTFNIHVKSESEFCESNGRIIVNCIRAKNIASSLASQTFNNELHQRHRIGFEYEYQPLDQESSWTDRLKLAVNKQDFRVNVERSTHTCTLTPFADPNCRPKYSNEELAETGYDFKQKQSSIGLELDKWLDIGWGEHDVKLNAGISKNKYTVNRHHSYIQIDYLNSGNLRPIHRNCINVKDKYGKNISVCERVANEFEDSGLPINQRKFYLSLNDQIAINRWLSADLGARWEINQFNSEQKQLPFDNYRSSAYRLGLNFHPTNYLTLGYKYSTGFRIPSAGEIYGSLSENNDRNNLLIGYGGIDFRTKLKPESSQMHEISARLNTDWANGNIALFSVDYNNLIGRGQLSRAGVVTAYHDRNYNLQQAKVHGVSLDLNADLHKIWNPIPDGLSATFSGTSVKLRDSAIINPDAYSSYMTTPLDSLQPLRIVYGLDYNAPNGKWGISHRVTYSKGKSEKELLTHGKVSGNTTVNNKSVGRHLSKEWSTVDILGYWKPYKNLTLNTGVYNLFNYQYTTWESTRQTIQSSNSPSVGRAQLAPARNFSLSLEYIF